MTLPVKGRAPMTSYARELFGEPWLDLDGNGCDTRNDVLSRDLVSVRYEPASTCDVRAGDLDDPYTGRLIGFETGYGDLVDIDHVVALGNAWVTGAFGWDQGKRSQFANDPQNLLAVDASANRQKGDGDAATWLPSNKAFRCSYVARQISVKATYGLWVTAPERDAMVRVLSRCPEEKVPGQTPPPARARPPVQTPATTAQSTSSRDDTAVTYFANCDAVRAAGVAPIRVGDPGYSDALDRDGDGTGCE